MNDDWDSHDWEMNVHQPSDEDDSSLSVAADIPPFNGATEVEMQSGPNVERGIPDLQCAKQYAKHKFNGSLDHVVFQHRDSGWFVTQEPSVPKDADAANLPIANYLGFQGGLDLIEALRVADRSTAEALISQGVDVNATDRRGVSPLMVAAYRGYSDICQRLISLGANIELEIPEYGSGTGMSNGEQIFDTPMTRARASRDPKTIDVLEKAWIHHHWKNASQLIQSNSSVSPEDFSYLIVRAAEHGLTRTCVEMIALGLNIDHESDNGTALRCSLDANYLQTAFVLAALGANIDGLHEMIDTNSELFRTIQSIHVQISATRNTQN